MTPSGATAEARHSGPAAIRRLSRPEPARRTAVRRSMHGDELGEVELAPEVFGIEPNQAVLHQVVTAQLAAVRSGTQSTKTRAEVRGGGAKPYRQKGTGRARQGSTRSPNFIGGGVALGPKPRSYSQRTPKKMVRLALHSALSDRAGRGRVAVVDAWTFEVPRTKEAVAALGALDLRGRVLLVLGDGDGYAERSFANLPQVRTLTSGELNAYEVLVHDWVVFTDETLPGATSGQVASGTEGAVADEADQTDEADDSARSEATETSEPPAGSADEEGS